MALDLETLSARLRTLCDEHAVPGATVTIVHGNGTYLLSHGVTDVTDPSVVDQYTLFAINSDTKPFTAYAALVLDEDGTIDIDRPVRDVLPSLRLPDENAAEVVTPRHLLQHTPNWTGDHLAKFYGPDALKDYVASIADLIQIAPPGRFASYSSSGYNLLGHLCAVAAQTTYEELVQRVLDDLAMRRSAFLVDRPSDPNVAIGHGVEDGVARPIEWDDARGTAPSGGLWSCADDLAEWLRVHVGDDAVAKQMRETTVPFGSATISDVGLGWFKASGYPTDVYRHGGGGRGHQSMTMLVPDERFGIAVLTNSAQGSRVHGAICAEVLNDMLGLAAPTPPPPIQIGADALAEYTGSYTSGAMHLELSLVDGELRASARFDWTDFVPEPLSLWFFAPDRSYLGEFFRDDDGRVTWLRWTNRATVRIDH